MITLNGKELSPDLTWQDRFASAKSLLSNRETNGQRAVIQHMTRPESGSKITLAAISDGEAIAGHFSQSQINEIREYERLGSQVPLHIHGFDFTVMVDAGGVNVTPVIDYSAPVDTDIFTGAVTFIQL